jgi:hypothetical protein
VELVWGRLFVAGFVLIPAVIGIWVATVPIRKAYRMRRAGGDRGNGPETPPQEPRLRLESIDRMSTEERLASATQDLREAHATLIAAQALLGDARSLSLRDIAGLAFDRGRAKQSSLGAAARQMRNAQQLMESAIQMMRFSGSSERIEFDERSILLELDTAWLGDGIVTGIAVHQRIKKAQQQAGRMLRRVAQLLERVGASAGR